MSGGLQQWLEQQPQFPGLRARGVHLADQQTLVQSFADDCPLDAVENLCRGAADTFRVLRLHQLPCGDLRWTYSGGIVQAVRRPDGVVLICLLEPGLTAESWDTLRRLHQAFASLDMPGSAPPPPV